MNINKMSIIEIGKYINSFPHRNPCIIKHSKGYDFFGNGTRKLDLTLKQAIKEMEKE